MDKRKKILIPWDFTEKAENAFAHAVQIAKISEHAIMLIHIIKEQSEYVIMEKSMKEEIARLKGKYGIEALYDIREGDIFHTINTVASELEAEMVIMGTHGIKGMQKITGSWALKVIIGSQVPFIVVQGPPKTDKINCIVVPYSFKREEKEKIKWAYQFHKYFRSKIYLVHPTFKDAWLRKSMAGNLRFARNFFDGVKVNYEIHTILKKSDLYNYSLNLARETNAEMLIIVVRRHLSWTGYVMGPEEQYMIANPLGIPVMCINPNPGKLTGSFSSTGG